MIGLSSGEQCLAYILDVQDDNGDSEHPLLKKVGGVRAVIIPHSAILKGI